MKRMSSALFFIFLALLGWGCDRGASINWPYDANVKVIIEREVALHWNNRILVFAKEFSQITQPDGTQIYRFLCPCYLGQDLYINNVAVKSNTLELSSVNDGALYNVDYEFKSK